jgi:hypothetical protein
VLFEAHCALKVKLRRHTVRSVQPWGWSARSKTSSSPCRRCSSANPSIESSNIQYEIRNVPGDLAEELSDLLLADGALSATIIEHRRPGANEEEIFKEKFGSSEFWKTCSVQVCYLLSEEEEQNAQHTTLMRTALTWTGADETVLGAIDISQGEEIKPMNWQQAILDEYQEIQIAENLKIVPTWGEADDNGIIRLCHQSQEIKRKALRHYVCWRWSAERTSTARRRRFGWKWPARGFGLAERGAVDRPSIQ